MDFPNSSVKTTDEIRSLCSSILHCDRNLAVSTIDRRSAAIFGIKPKVCVFLWYSLEGLLPNRAEPKHFLWALSFLKLYEVEESRASRFQVDEKTCRKSTKIFVTAISELNFVCFFVNCLIYLTIFRYVGRTDLQRILLTSVSALWMEQTVPYTSQLLSHQRGTTIRSTEQHFVMKLLQVFEKQGLNL